MHALSIPDKSSGVSCGQNLSVSIAADIAHEIEPIISEQYVVMKLLFEALDCYTNPNKSGLKNDLYTGPILAIEGKKRFLAYKEKWETKINVNKSQ